MQILNLSFLKSYFFVFNYSMSEKNGFEPFLNKCNQLLAIKARGCVGVVSVGVFVLERE